MLTGGGNKPFPRDCPQDCQIGPFYAHGRFNETPLREVNTTKWTIWPDGRAMFNAPAPLAQSLNFRVPSVLNCEPAMENDAHGLWVGSGLYQITLPGPVQNFTIPKMV